MKKTNSVIMFLLAVMVLSCDDIIEEDISNDNISTITPTEGTVISGNTVQFSWQQLDGADDYRIQIMNTENQNIVLDSLTSNTTFNYIMNPGEYQWRIKGVNFAYSTPYTFPINFSVEASDNLSNQNVMLLTPSDNFYTNNTSIILTWSPIVNTDHYNLEVIKIDVGEETILQETNIMTTNFNMPVGLIIDDAEYTWKVKAVNISSETPFTERSIFLDRQVPSQPVLVSPNDMEEISAFNVTFNWTNGQDTGNIQSVLTNTVEISTDSSFSTLLLSENIEGNSLTVTFDSSDLYYWRVLTFDEAGNIGDYSIVRSLVIQ